MLFPTFLTIPATRLALAQGYLVYVITACTGQGVAVCLVQFPHHCLDVFSELLWCYQPFVVLLCWVWSFWSLGFTGYSLFSLHEANATKFKLLPAVFMI